MIGEIESAAVLPSLPLISNQEQEEVRNVLEVCGLFNKQ